MVLCVRVWLGRWGCWVSKCGSVVCLCVGALLFVGGCAVCVVVSVYGDVKC